VKPRALVLTTVHHPDDTRIREKLIRSLADDFDVVYAVRYPGPRDLSDLRWRPLRGGRAWRNLSAWRHGLFGRYNVLSLHDPELLPLGLAARLIRRKPVVFDVHEDIPAQIRTKPWLPAPLRRPAAWTVHRLLRVAERAHAITLAEPGYRSLLRRDHAVFPNHLDPGRLPEPVTERERIAVYVGDITEARGLREAAAAAGAAGMSLHLVGPVSPRERTALDNVAAAAGAVITFHGRVTHRRAMELLGGASVAVSPLHDLPNYRDALPTKVLEYLAMGVPVVASDLPGTRAALEGLDAVWLVPPGEITPMAHALTEASGAEAIAAATAQAPRVRDRFRWPADEVATFYLGLAR
jgi:glycosyltransferase involved in cell wall biosynthesis